ncbi:hypothetical protein AAES_60351 [Amazona aestiva]|uniref:Phosphatidic acid phosphatase type 2/haloperoxidase domain-containing protein n=1 Tax=Amazona aestiva TaxID=12930 RepID=A0A0Q3TRT5_AMAAE|nr:hypothetical protein AAES_60351 [Amazona aestiva]
MYFNSIISDSTKLLKPILVFAFAIAAGICGLTQITQYRSHPADVYVGFLIGSGIAAYLRQQYRSHPADVYVGFLIGSGIAAYLVGTTPVSYTHLDVYKRQMPEWCSQHSAPPQLPIVASSIVTLYFLELTDLFKPAKVGFQCYDRALSMPYVETNEELIPLLMLLSLAFAAPAASVRPRGDEDGARFGHGVLVWGDPLLRVGQHALSLIHI